MFWCPERGRRQKITQKLQKKQSRKAKEFSFPAVIEVTLHQLSVPNEGEGDSAISSTRSIV
jgi:hypothetical protein